MSAPEGMVWGCESCEFWTSIEADAGKHSDQFKHSLALRPSPYELAGPTTSHAANAWTLMPPATDACQVCASTHDPREPHNPESLYWQMKRQMDGEPPPTWADALAHVEDPLRQAWVDALAERGVVVVVEGETYVELPEEP